MGSWAIESGCNRGVCVLINWGDEAVKGGLVI